ncbi:MAG: hypothetical protein OEM52_02320 [bacterium]|nr:hypothetical protein [bacterium]
METSPLIYQDWPPGSALGMRRHAHDLMTPLTVIMGNLQLFGMRKDLPPQVEAKVNDLFNQAKNLLKMIQEIQRQGHEQVYGPESGKLYDRMKEGVDTAGSELTRSTVKVELQEPFCQDVWLGEAQVWREWFGSLFASLAGRLQIGGRIYVSCIEGGWQLQAKSLNTATDKLDYWLAVLERPMSEKEIIGVQIYHAMLALNRCVPVVTRDGETLTVEYRRG